MSFMTPQRILICGLPGAGKTTLARALAPKIDAVMLDGDYVRRAVDDVVPGGRIARIAHATRMRALAQPVLDAGHHVVCSFGCPTKLMREVFDATLTVWVDRENDAKARGYLDTLNMWEPPEREAAFRVTAGITSDQWAERIAGYVMGGMHMPHALLVGRFQPFHKGHEALVLEAIRQHGRVCIGVREVRRTKTDNPFPFEQVKARIDRTLAQWAGLFTVIRMPNIATIVYGRKPGYTIQEIDLPDELKAVSATAIRRAASSASKEVT